MGRSFAQLCSVCKEDHALIASPNPPFGNVCICDRCLETVARDNVVWICLGCREVYLERKNVILQRTADPAARRIQREFISECVIQGLENCIHCSGEAAFTGAVEKAALLFC